MANPKLDFFRFKLKHKTGTNKTFRDFMTQGISNVWQACSGRVDRGQSSSVLHSKGLCPRLCRPLQDRRLPV